MQVIKLQLIVDTRATEIFRRDQDGRFLDSQYFTPSGVELCQAVMEHLKTTHQFAIPRLAAERIILSVGSALPASEGWSVAVMGGNLSTGLPERREITTSMVQEPIDNILGGIVLALARNITANKSNFLPDATFDNEIILSGEYSEVKGLKKRLRDTIRAEAMPEATIVIVPKNKL